MSSPLEVWKSGVPEAQRPKLETRRDQSQLTGDQEARNPVEKKAEMVCPKAEIVPEGEEAEMGPKAMGPKALKLTYPKAEKCPKARKQRWARRRWARRR